MNAAELARRVRGAVLEPTDRGFDEARAMWNGRFDRRPDLIARCLDATDVQAAVEVARTAGWPISVKGSGHSYAARSVQDGGLLIDLSLLKSIEIDRAARRATIGGGVTCGELDAASQADGLATPTPTVSSVGVAGAALGGGGGWLSRKFGLSLDNLVSAEVVTADGSLVTASRDVNPDLFWAIRGGGGNFGIATSLVLSLHEAGPRVLAGQVIYPLDDGATMLRFFREFMAEAPNELQCYPFMFRIPPIDAFPAETHGQPVIDFVICHQNPGAADAVQPLRELGTPILDAVGPTGYVEVQKSFDPNLPKGQRYLSKAHDLDDLSDAAIDTVLEFVPEMRGAFTAAYFDPQGGAIAAVPADETAYGARTARYGFHCLAGWMDPADDADVISWATRLHQAMSRTANGSVYVNLIADDEPDRVPAAYGDGYARLVEMKRRWDPENVFQSNYNIPPQPVR